MSIIYVVMGHSGSGKDTIGNYLLDTRRSSLVKFAAPGKRALEFMLKVESGLMDDRVKRLEVAPHCQGRTYLQVLVDFWKHRSLLVGDDLFTSQTVDVIKDTLENGRDVIITDVRSIDEMEALKTLVDDEVLLDITWVNRKAAQCLESDKLQYIIFQELSNVSSEYRFLVNNGSYREFTKLLQETYGV